MPGLAGAGGNAGAIKAGEAYVAITADDKEAQATLARIKARFVKFGGWLTGVGKGMLAFGAGAAAIGAAATLPIANTLTDLGKVQDVADAFGTTGKAASGLFGLLAHAGGEFKENMEGIIQFSSTVKKALDGVGQGVELFDGLSVTAQELEGLAVDEQFYRVLAAIRELPQPMQEAKLALLGGSDSLKQWQKLLTMSNEEVRAVAEELSISNESLRQASNAAKAYQSAITTIGRAWQEVVIALSPLIQWAAEVLTPMLKWAREFAEHNRTLVIVITLVVAAVTAAGVALAALGLVVIGVGGAITALATAIGVIGAVASFIATPVGALVALIVALGVVVAAAGAIITVIFWDEIWATLIQFVAWINSTFKESIDAFGLMFEGIAAAIKKGNLKLALAILAAGLVVVWYDMIMQLKNMFMGFVKWLVDKLTGIARTIADMFAQIPGMGDMVDKLRGAIEIPNALLTNVDAALTAILQRELNKAKAVLAALVGVAKREDAKEGIKPMPKSTIQATYGARTAITEQRSSISADNARQRFAQGESFERQKEKTQEEIAANTKKGADEAEKLNNKFPLKVQ